MRRRARVTDLWPPQLREFREEDWPPVAGECLGHYACRGDGYGADCVPLPGEACGQRCYLTLEIDHGDDEPDLLARAQRADAFTRFHQARLAHLGEDHPRYLDELLAGFGAYEEIRYGRRPGS